MLTYVYYVDDVVSFVDRYVRTYVTYVCKYVCTYKLLVYSVHSYYIQSYSFSCHDSDELTVYKMLTDKIYNTV